MSEYERSTGGYTRTTTRSRREANKPRFIHYSKWIDVVPDEEGNPEYRVHFKTKVLTEQERSLKMLKTKHGRAELAWQIGVGSTFGPFATTAEALQDALEEAPE